MNLVLWEPISHIIFAFNIMQNQHFLSPNFYSNSVSQDADDFPTWHLTLIFQPLPQRRAAACCWQKLPQPWLRTSWKAPANSAALLEQIANWQQLRLRLLHCQVQPEKRNSSLAKKTAALMDERSSAMFVIHLPACPLPSLSSPGSVWGLHCKLHIPSESISLMYLWQVSTLAADFSLTV